MLGLFSYGLVLAVSVFLGLILTIIGLFVGHIILFDSIVLAVISGVVCNRVWQVHPALCLVLSIGVFLLLFWLQHTAAGFWIIGILLSAFWAFVFGFLAYACSGEDMVWFYVVLVLGFFVMLGLHRRARGV